MKTSTLKVMIIAIIFGVATVALTAFAQDESAAEAELDYEAARMAMENECNELIELAAEKVEQAKKLKGRAFVYADREMMQQAEILFDEADQLLEAAGLLSEECAVKVEEYLDSRRKKKSSPRLEREKKRPPEYY